MKLLPYFRRCTLRGTLIALAITLPLHLQAQSGEGRKQLGYRLSGSLGADVRAYQGGNQQGLDYASAWLEEGGRLVFTGHVWKPSLLRFDLRGEGFGVHVFNQAGISNGYRLGAGVRFTLLPSSYFPLTLTAERLGSGVAPGALPGHSYMSDVLGLDWRFALPELPRFYLSLRNVTSAISSQSAIPTGLTGASRGQEREGSTRRARLALVHSNEGSQASARYSLEERSDSSGGQGQQDLEQRMLSQQVDIDAHVNLGDGVNWDTYVAGHVLSFGGSSAISQSRVFNLRSVARFSPDEKMDGWLQYGFHGSSTTDSSGNSLHGEVDWRYSELVGLRSRLFVDQTDYAPGAPYDLLVSEGVGLSAYVRATRGALEGSAEEGVSIGGSQVDPGDPGLLLMHNLAGQALWRISHKQMLSLATGVSNRLDMSSVGGELDQARIDARWFAFWPLRIRSSLTGGLYNTLLLDRRFELSRDRQREARLEARADMAVTHNLGAAIGTGYRASDSSRSIGLGHTLYTTGVLSYRPLRNLNVSGDLTWFLLSFQEQERNNLRARVMLGWWLRKIYVGAEYRFDLDDRIGQQAASHLLLAKIIRRFDLGF